MFENINNRWETFVVIALIAFTVSVSLRKYILINNKCSYCDFIFIFTLGVGLFSLLACCIIYSMYQKNLFKNKNNMKIIVPILFTAFLMTLGMIFKNRGYYLVSNVAVLDGVMEPLKILLLFIISYLFLSAKVNLKLIIGIVLTLFGLNLMLNNQ
jgi:drug/metabolite transporter (DMT)-like permease